MRGDARRMSHITPNMSTMPTHNRLWYSALQERRVRHHAHALNHTLQRSYITSTQVQQYIHDQSYKIWVQLQLATAEWLLDIPTWMMGLPKRRSVSPKFIPRTCTETQILSPRLTTKQSVTTTTSCNSIVEHHRHLHHSRGLSIQW